jgi:DNA mismatch endonuclease, patch repair protein
VGFLSRGVADAQTLPRCRRYPESMSEFSSWASSPARRRNMQANRSRDTKPELAVRRLVHAAGLRYRVHVAPSSGLRRKADLVFTRQRVAIFIDGCFWHGCRQHSHDVRMNASYWTKKIGTNIARDADTNARLSAIGWTVLRYWEHQDPGEVACHIIGVIRSTRHSADADLNVDGRLPIQ